MRLYRTNYGSIIESGDEYRRIPFRIADLLHRDALPEFLKREYESARPVPFAGLSLYAPLDAQEVWAAGVTYYRSRTARMEESEATGGESFYDRVYAAERPELFFKSSGRRVAGPQEPIRIRFDSTWNVPEPELTLVISSGGVIVGYTVGNDVSSRDIEGANPLYLPQAKVYNQSCALGPAILISSDPLAATTTIRMEVMRDGASEFAGETTLESLKRSPTELVEYLFRDHDHPDGVFLMTGTGIVPDPPFSLQAGDTVTIEIEGIGRLSNRVVQSTPA